MKEDRVPSGLRKTSKLFEPGTGWEKAGDSWLVIR